MRNKTLELHTSCDHCGSSDGATVYQDDNGKRFKHCYVCKKTDQLDGYSPRHDSKRYDFMMTPIEMPELLIPEAHPFLKKRGIKAESVAKYGAGFTDDGKVFTAVYYDQNGAPIFAKHRNSAKKFWTTGSDNAAHLGLYGWHAASTKKYLLIVEGELDAISASQMMGGYFTVVSVPFGVGDAAERVRADLARIEAYEKVYVAMDSDAPGQEAQQAILDVLDGAYSVTLPTGFKDASDMLSGGEEKAFQQAIWAGQRVTPSGFVDRETLIGRTLDFLRDKNKRVGHSFGWDGLDAMFGGQRPGEVITWVSGTGVGKAQTLDTGIVMHDGSIKRAGDVVEGDLLANGIEVQAVSPIWEQRPIIRVTFDDGTSYDVDENHTWWAYTQRRKIAPVEVATKDMYADYLTRYVGQRKVYAVDIVATDYPEKEQLIDPYLLGVWLGDGTSTSGTITSHTDDDYILAPYGAEKRGDRYLWFIPGLQTKLREAGVLNNKHVPDEYLYGSTEQRMELLRGLLDTDGGVERSTAYFYNSDKNLFDQTVTLARSLGYKVFTYEKMGKLYGVETKMSYQARIVSPKVTRLFKLERKQALLRPQQKGSAYKFVSSMEYVAPQDTVCFMVTGGIYQLEGHTITHNSSLLRNLLWNLYRNQVSTAYLPFEDLTEVALTQLAQLDLGRNVLRLDEIDESTGLELADSLDGMLQYITVLDKFDWSEPEEVVKKLEYAARIHGAQVLVLDHITWLAESSTEDSRIVLERVMPALKQLATRRGVTIHIISHLSQDKTDKDDNKPTINRLKNSGAIKQVSDAVIGIEGDRESNRLRIFPLKQNRLWGRTDVTEAVLEYDQVTTRLVEVAAEDFANDFEEDDDEDEKPVRERRARRDTKVPRDNVRESAPAPVFTHVVPARPADTSRAADRTEGSSPEDGAGDGQARGSGKASEPVPYEGGGFIPPELD